MWPDTTLLDLLGIEHPIIQAPMASATNPVIVAAVSNAGGLGSFGAAGTPPLKLRETIRAIRGRTNRPFNINLFAAHTEDFDRDARPGGRLGRQLEAYHAEFGLGAVPVPRLRHHDGLHHECPPSVFIDPQQDFIDGQPLPSVWNKIEQKQIDFANRIRSRSSSPIRRRW